MIFFGEKMSIQTFSSIFLFRLFALKYREKTPVAHRVKEAIFPGIFPKISSMRARLNDLKFSTKEKSPEHFLEVYLTPTSQANGSGHISMSMIKKQNNEASVVTHMSYVPTALMTLVNGATLGTIPVLSENVGDIRDDDIIKSTSIYRIPVSKDAFDRGLEEDRKIKEGVDKGIHLYAVTGVGNLMSVFLTALWGYYLGHNKAIENFKLHYATTPHEDHLGFVVTDLASIPEQPVQAKLFNCTQAVSSILHEVGLPVDKSDVLPATLGHRLSQVPGVVCVQESMVMPAASMTGEETVESHVDHVNGPDF